MNVKSLLLLLAFTGFGVSCNSDDPDGPGTGGIAGRTELQIAFSGTGESVEYDTKATASEKENQIDKLEIYLFAAATQTGTYYFLEKWTDGAAYDPANPTTTNFKKSETGTGWKASLYPGELKGYPFVKLMCVANNGAVAGITSDGEFYAEDGTTAIVGSSETSTPPLVPISVNDAGVIQNEAAATKEEDFKKTFTRNLGTDAATGIIATPLLMTGTGETKIAGSVSKVDITLKRIVARFDIENNVTKSNLTIQKVTLSRGRTNGTLWGTARTVVAKDATSALLTTYQPVDFTKIPGANTGITESALYTYPNLDTDESFLILEGTYKSPISSAQVPVTYNVPITRTAEGADKGTYIPVMPNSRYRLKITDVTQSNVFGTFEVVDWTSGGGIVVKPDNDAPVFTGKAAFSTAAGQEKFIPKKLPDGTATGDTCNYEVVEAAGGFSIEIAATGAVRAELGVVTKAGIPTWLTKGTLTSKEKDGVWYTKFDFTYADAIGKEPVAVTFINDAASYDPALWTTINFYGPKAVPEFSVVTDGNSKGNLTVVDGTTKAPTASLYNVKGSYVTFDIYSIEGVTPGTLAGYKIEEIKKKEPKDFVHTYKISVDDVATAANGNIEFANTGDPDKKTLLKVTKLETGMKAELLQTTYASMTGDATTGYVITVDLETLAANSFTFKVNSPEGLGTPAPTLTSGWLAISDGNDWAVGNKFNTYTVKAQGTTYGDAELTFANGIAGAAGVKVTLKKGNSKVKMSVPGGEVNGKNKPVTIVDGQIATADMFATNEISNQLQLTVTSLDGVAATAAGTNGLTATKAGDVWTIKTDGTATTGTGTVTFTSAKSSETAVLTVTYKDPKIVATTTGDGEASTEVDGNTIYVNPATIGLNSFSVKLAGDAATSGSTVSLESSTATWATVSASGILNAAGMKTCQVDPTGTTTDITDYVIKVKNAITGQDELFTLKYQMKP